MNLAVYRALDDDTLAALASRGLLRRAQKDLEREPPVLAARDAASLTLSFPAEGVSVSLPAAGPQAARCTCPAGAACRHILAACLFLRSYDGEPAAPAPAAPQKPPPAVVAPPPDPAAGRSPASADGEPAAPAPTAAQKPPPAVAAPPPAAPPPDPAAELLAVSEAELLAWAGRAVFRQGLEAVAEGVELSEEPAGQILILALPALGVTVRWLAGAGLSGAICSCKSGAPCRHRVAAVIAAQARRGKAPPAVERAALAAAAGAPRSRAEVIAAAAGALHELIALGLMRLSGAAAGRLQTLAVSAHGVDLPRLERELRALAARVGWHVARDVRADAAETLAAAARVAALAAALAAHQAAPPGALVGSHRARYSPAGGLDLVGLGALQWRTRSGYSGLTVYLWDAGARRWCSWSDGRPTFYGGVTFDPLAAYSAAPAWEASPPPLVVSRSRLRLSAARRSREGRLSRHAGSSAVVIGPADPAALDLAGVRFDDWRALAAHLAAARPGGLAEAPPLADLVVLAPADWGPPAFDQRRQAVTRPLLDGAGRPLSLVAPEEGAVPSAAATLHDWEPAAHGGTWGVLARAALTPGGIEALPVALYTAEALPGGSPILNLSLDPWRGQAAPPLPAAPGAPSAPPAPADEDPGTDEAELLEEAPALALDTAPGRLLGAAEALLTRLAERGAAAASAPAEEELAELAGRLDGLGLVAVGRALKALRAQLAAARHAAAPDPRPAAAALLRAAYVTRLAAEQLTVARAEQALARA